MAVVLALTSFLAAQAYDFEVDGIYYNKNGNEATVTNQTDKTYSGDVMIPSSVTYNGETLSVTGIGDRAFFNCTGLTSIAIPNSVTNIGNYALKGCSGFSSFVPDNVQYIGKAAFPTDTVYVKRGSYALLALWNSGYVPYEAGAESKLAVPTFTILGSTQTTVTGKIDNKYPEYAYLYEDKELESDQVTLTGFLPQYSGTIDVYVQKATDDNTSRLRLSQEYQTKNISPSIRCVGSASSIKVTGSYVKGDAKVVKEELTLGSVSHDGAAEHTFSGLNPNTSYEASYTITLDNGKSYTAYRRSSTTGLTLETQQPKVVTEGNIVMQAKSNLDDAETNVGFEWRRTDWTDDFASNSGGAHLYEGTMEGYIRNLNTNHLWKYRPYYESNSGRRYYGDWVGIDPTNTSYFEPTVHTYASVSVDGNSAKVRGYAQRGTDNIASQGFAYWKAGSQAAKAKAAANIPTDAQTVEVKGTVMETTLSGLDYNTTYTYVAYVTTSEGETFYGSEQTFTTGEDLTGIDAVAAGNAHIPAAGIYDLQGRKHATLQRGMNIVRHEDGSVRKVYVK